MKVRIKSNQKEFGQWEVQQQYKWWPYWFTIGYFWGTPEHVVSEVRNWLAPDKTLTSIEVKL